MPEEWKPRIDIYSKISQEKHSQASQVIFETIIYPAKWFIKMLSQAKEEKIDWVDVLENNKKGGKKKKTEGKGKTDAKVLAVDYADSLRGNKEDKNTVAVIVTLEGDIIYGLNGEGVYNSKVQKNLDLNGGSIISIGNVRK